MTRQPVDRVPVFPSIWLDHAVRISGISALAMIREPWAGYRAMLSTARHYGLDAFKVFLVYEPRQVEVAGDEVYELDRQTGARVGTIDIQGGWASRPLAGPHYVADLAEAKRLPVAAAQTYWDDGRCVHMKQVVEEAGEDFAVCGRPQPFTLNFLLAKRGSHQYLVDLYDEPELAHALMEKALAICLEQSRAMYRAGVRLFYMGDANSSCSLISPQFFKTFAFPYYQQYCAEMHRMDGAVVMIHTCGNTVPIAEMIADTGVDCMDTMDPMGGVDPADIKQRVGHRACLMGGVSPLTLLNGTAAQVESESRDCIRKAGPGGGYVLCSGCMVPRDTPAANIEAMVRATRRYGNYDDGRLTDAAPA